MQQSEKLHLSGLVSVVCEPSFLEVLGSSSQLYLVSEP